MNEENEIKNQKQLVQKERESVSSIEKLMAQTDQLLLQEKEIETLRQELQISKQSIVNLETNNSIERNRMREELLSYVQKTRQLEDTKRELDENIGLYKERNREIHLAYQKLQAQYLELQEDLSRADKQNNSIDSVRKDNSNLKTQVLVLTELYQGLKDRFAVINKNATNDEIFAVETESRNKELKDLKSKLETTVHQMEAFKMKSIEIESQTVKKDNLIAELKNIIENNKISHKKQLQVLFTTVFILKYK